MSRQEKEILRHRGQRILSVVCTFPDLSEEEILSFYEVLTEKAKGFCREKLFDSLRDEYDTLGSNKERALFPTGRYVLRFWVTFRNDTLLCICSEARFCRGNEILVQSEDSHVWLLPKALLLPPRRVLSHLKLSAPKGARFDRVILRGNQCLLYADGLLIHSEEIDKKP